jgi:hypothetical protein
MQQCSFCSVEDRGRHSLFEKNCRLKKAFDNPAWPTKPAYVYQVPLWADAEMRAMLLTRVLYLINQGNKWSIVPMKIHTENGMVSEYAFICE